VCTSHISLVVFFFSSRRRHTRSKRDWSSDVCSSDLNPTYPFSNIAVNLEVVNKIVTLAITTELAIIQVKIVICWSCWNETEKAFKEKSETPINTIKQMKI